MRSPMQKDDKKPKDVEKFSEEQFLGWIEHGVPRRNLKSFYITALYESFMKRKRGRNSSHLGVGNTDDAPENKSPLQLLEAELAQRGATRLKNRFDDFGPYYRARHATFLCNNVNVNIADTGECITILMGEEHTHPLVCNKHKWDINGISSLITTATAERHKWEPYWEQWNRFLDRKEKTESMHSRALEAFVTTQIAGKGLTHAIEKDNEKATIHIWLNRHYALRIVLHPGKLGTELPQTDKMLSNLAHIRDQHLPANTQLLPFAAHPYLHALDWRLPDEDATGQEGNSAG